ncbi:MAG: NAD(P)-binding domain-containing protein, partial [Lachnospiraceae bacterium]|nr:NAD(P)-binding domain-containing protein [Lachnospiraceae bacterium]
MAKVGMIGAGSWGIALSVLLHNNGHDITVWSALTDEIHMLNREHEHKDKLPGVTLAEDIVFTTALEEAVKEKDILVLAVPSSFTRATAHSMRDFVKEGQIIVNVAKGIEESTPMPLSQVIEEESPRADVA